MLWCLCVIVLKTVLVTAIPLIDFVPYGKSFGDKFLPEVDDVAQNYTIPLSGGLPFFGQHYNTLFVSIHQKHSVKYELETIQIYLR